MIQQTVMLLRKSLEGALSAPCWPKGIRLLPFDYDAHGVECHRLLEDSYDKGQGSVDDFDQWWPAIAGDEEYDPEAMYVAVDGDGAVIAFAHCWSSAFLKDLAVARDWRRKGIGAAMLAHGFHLFRDRGCASLALKVHEENDAALALYLNAGMRAEQ